jgi:hypothetical protein
MYDGQFKACGSYDELKDKEIANLLPVEGGDADEKKGKIILTVENISKSLIIIIIN